MTNIKHNAQVPRLLCAVKHCARIINHPHIVAREAVRKNVTGPHKLQHLPDRGRSNAHVHHKRQRTPIRRIPCPLQRLNAPARSICIHAALDAKYQVTISIDNIDTYISVTIIKVCELPSWGS